MAASAGAPPRLGGCDGRGLGREGEGKRARPPPSLAATRAPTRRRDGGDAGTRPRAPAARSPRLGSTPPSFPSARERKQRGPRAPQGSPTTGLGAPAHPGLALGTPPLCGSRPSPAALRPSAPERPHLRLRTVRGVQGLRGSTPGSARFLRLPVRVLSDQWTRVSQPFAPWRRVVAQRPPGPSAVPAAGWRVTNNQMSEPAPWLALAVSLLLHLV